jgi:hypothetical protein
VLDRRVHQMEAGASEPERISFSGKGILLVQEQEV